jgi:hypothetical protein
MDWSDISKLIAPLAPVLGTALGGPLGGVAGKVLAETLGTAATPDAVGKAIEAGGASIGTALQQAESDAAARWAFLTEAVKAEAAQGQAINETMRAEIAGGSPWYSWRNMGGYELLTFECPVFFMAALALVGHDLWSNNFQGVNTFVQLCTSVMRPYFFARVALLGCVAQDSTRRQTTAMIGEHPPTILGTVVKSLATRR